MHLGFGRLNLIDLNRDQPVLAGGDNQNMLGAGSFAGIFVATAASNWQKHVVFVFCLNGMFHFGMFQQPIFPRFFKQKALRYWIDGGTYNLGARFLESYVGPCGLMPPKGRERETELPSWTSKES